MTALTRLIALSYALPFPLWPLLQCGAILGAAVWFWRRTRPRELRRLRAPLAAGFVGAGLGAHVLAIAMALPSNLRAGHGLHSLIEGGQMAYGSLLGLALVYSVGARWRGFEVPASLDVLAPTIGVMIGLARLGCFFGGCDFGRVTSGSVGVRYPAGSPAFHQHLADGLVLARDRTSLAVHPTQLYEALLGLLVAMVAWAVPTGRDESARPGTAFALAASTYAAGRFAIELVRGDTSRGFLWGVSTSQWLSFGVVVAAFAWAFRGPRQSSAQTTAAAVPVATVRRG